MGRQKGNMYKLDWRGVGQFLAVCVTLGTTIIGAFKKAKVGIEVMGWLICEEGKAILEKSCAEIAAAYLASDAHKATLPKPEVKVLTATLDLATTPRPPFAGAAVEKHTGQGTVTIEKRADGQLYIDGKKVILHLSGSQLGGKSPKGHELRTELDGKLVLNATILDFLEDHREFIPDDWKKGEQGNTRFVYFWGTVYRRAGGNLYVLYLFWDGQRWRFGYQWLYSDWRGSCPAACLVS